MAHKYSNFADAYTFLESRWSIANTKQANAYSYCNTATGYADVSNWKSAIYYCTYAIKSTLSAFDNLLGNYLTTFDYGIYPELVYWASKEGGGSVDMDSILTAMMGADFDELQKFVGLVDAYRVAIWNAPFNADFYAALARGFQKWPQY